MINLIDYFFEHAKSNKCFSEKFYHLPLEKVDKEALVFDEIEAISKFKDLIYPYNNSEKEEKKDLLFILICFYLHNEDYIMDEFPIFLERPTSRWDLAEHKIKKAIRDKRTENKYEDVLWRERRDFVDSLNFKKRKGFLINSDLEKLIKNVSISESEFNLKSSEQKLLDITNVIENELKAEGEYIILDYSDTFNLLTNEVIIEYRKVLHHFRHSNQESVDFRNNLSEIQKEFLIDFGIMIIKYIYAKKRNKK